MKNISIIVDSGSDILPEQAKTLGVKVLPLNIRFGEEQFKDGETISRDDFYNRMTNAKQLPKTSLISPAVYEETFEEEVSKGNDVVCIVLSSCASGCYQSACLAAQEYEGKVFVVDSKQLCGPEQLLVKRAIQLKQDNLSAKEIVEKLLEETNHIKVVAMFDTLEYLMLGGRISKGVAMVGEMLSIKPILTIDNGEIKLLSKARGLKNGIQKMISEIETRGIDWQKPVILSYSGNSMDRVDLFLEKASLLFEGHEKEYELSRVGATIGTYAGAGAVALSFYEK